MFDDGEGDLRDDLAEVLVNKNGDQATQDKIAFKRENIKNLKHRSLSIEMLPLEHLLIIGVTVRILLIITHQLLNF